MKGKIILCLLVLLCTISSVNAALTDDILAYYKFDSDASDSVNSHDGTVTGATLVSGKIGNAYDFDGMDDFIEIADNLHANEMSFSVWVNFDQVTGRYSIISKRAGLTSDVFQLEFPLNYNKIHFLSWDSDGTYRKLEEYSALPTANTWHHYAITRSSSMVTLYRDGVKFATLPVAGGLQSTTLSTLIGKMIYQGTDYYFFDGTIDEVGIWSRALTENEIIELYNSGDGFQYPFSIDIPPLNESEARLEIESAINTSLSGATIKTDQSMFLGYDDSSSVMARFDKVAILNDNYWAFNYITDGEANVSVSNMTSNFFVWQGYNLGEGEVSSAVENLISSTS